jgi:hypothetical protein
LGSARFGMAMSSLPSRGVATSVMGLCYQSWFTRHAPWGQPVDGSSSGSRWGGVGDQRPGLS